MEDCRESTGTTVDSLDRFQFGRFGNMSVFAISMGLFADTNKQHTAENDQDDQGENQTTHEEVHHNGGVTMVHDGMFVVFRWNRRCEKRHERSTEFLIFETLTQTTSKGSWPVFRPESS